MFTQFELYLICLFVGYYIMNDNVQMLQELQVEELESQTILNMENTTFYVPYTIDYQLPVIYLYE